MPGSLKPETLADLRVIASTCALGALSLACRMAMTLSASSPTISLGFFDWLPVIAVASLIAGVGLYFGSRSVAALGFGMSMIFIIYVYLPEAIDAVLHFGRGYAYADTTLAAVDRALGFDWVTYARWMDASPWLWTISRYAYLSLPLLPLVVVVSLSLHEATERLATYFVVQMVCLTTVAGLAIFVPALGTYEHYRAADLLFAHRDFVTAAHMTRSLEWLRQAELVGNGVDYEGLVSFPSYHAMSCVLNAWAMWRSRWGRWPMAALSLIILIATPVQGSHYLVDIVAGIVIAVVAIKPSALLVAQLSMSRNWHSSSPAPALTPPAGAPA